MSFHDVELLSAYLDGQLKPSEAMRLELRLARERDLQRLMDELRASRGLLRALPRRKAPRNFTLGPRMRGLTAPAPRAFPVLRFASVLTSLLFLATLAVNGLTPLAANRLAVAPAPSYGMGGGGPPAEAPTPATPATAATLESLLTTQLTPAPERTAPAPDLQAQAQRNVPQVQKAPSVAQPLIPPLWQLVLAGLAIILGLIAWYLRSDSTRKFRRRWVEK